MSDFRITVHMHNFFEDYRSSCRLYITSKIKTIEDLKKHISKLFDVVDKDFYLISNNLYLPNLENVHVLREDDVVSVIPYDRSFPTSLSSQNTTSDNKAFKRNKASSNEGDNQELLVGGVKKKKKRKNLENEASNCIHNETDNFDPPKKEKKNKKSKNESSFNDVKEKQSNEAKNGVTFAQLFEELSKKKQQSVPPVNKPFGPFIFPRKNVKLMEISPVPKIIKSIVVNDSSTGIECSPKYETKIEIPPSFNYINTQINNLSNEFKIIQQKLKDKIKNGIPTTGNVKILSIESFNNQNKNEELLQKNESIGPQLIPVLQNSAPIILNNNKEEMLLPQSNPPEVEVDDESFKNPSIIINTPSESVVSSVTEESGVDLSLSFETKRKRKRVRKRKPKKTPEQAFEQAPNVVIPNVFTSAVAPVKHIRFENDYEQNEIIKNCGEEEITLPTPDVINNEENSSSKPVVNNDIGNCAAESNNYSSKVIDVNLNYEKLCNEEILKYPIMKEKFPKQGDIIAFKICKLSDCYTPEISNVIIGKVLSFCTITNNVILKILEGADECCVPEGKFYMESDENNEENEEKTFAWSDLIEPRLLFP